MTVLVQRMRQMLHNVAYGGECASQQFAYISPCGLHSCKPRTALRLWLSQNWLENGIMNTCIVLLHCIHRPSDLLTLAGSLEVHVIELA